MNVEHPNDVYLKDAKDYPNDKYEFTYKKYEGKLGRNKFGKWCGYIVLPKNHLYIGKDYETLDIDVHGGITYGSGSMYGFDTGHLKDYTPMNINCKQCFGKMGKICNKCKDSRKYGLFGDRVTYKTYSFVVEQIKYMADQFMELDNK